MPVTQRRYSKEELARRANAIYERDIRPVFERHRNREFVVIEVETGAYEVDRDELAASDRLVARVPDAQVWVRRVGSPYVCRFGGHTRQKP